MRPACFRWWFERVPGFLALVGSLGTLGDCGRGLRGRRVAVLARRATFTGGRAAIPPAVVLAGLVHHLPQPAHAPRLLRRARVLREPPAAVRTAAPRSLPGRAGVSRRGVAPRVAAAVAGALAACACAQHAAAPDDRLFPQPVDRIGVVRRRDAVLAVAVGVVLRHAGLAP